MRNFKGKVAVITGAASGIGHGLAKRCIREGMQVVLADVDESALAQTEEELAAMGGNTLSVLTDVSKVSDIEALARVTVDTFGAVHLLCNNAGVGAGSSIWESTLSDWEWVMGVNLWGVIHGIRVFVPIMLLQDTECHIVNTASIAGLLPDHPGAAYQVTKHAVVALSEHLHLSLTQQSEKIKASVLCPGFVKTQILNSGRNRPRNFQDDSSRNLPTSDEVEARWAGIQDQYNVISPAQVADVVFKSIREDRFYIFTHPEFTESVQVRFENILQGKNPTPVFGSF